MRPELFLIALWRHECDRTFVDKLISNGDKKIFGDLLDRVTKEKYRDQLGLDDEQLMTDTLFADFQRKDEFDEYGDLVAEAPFVYEACPDIDAIKNIANDKLEAYNTKNSSKQMNLVIFDDALKHLLRITRILNTPGGNIMLVGVGGSGKQSLTKLASFITKKEFFQIALTKTYGDSQLRDDVRELYNKAGPMGKSVSFILTDSEIKSETFLEAINSMLATGEIPGLIPKEDKDVISLECKTVFAREVGLTKGVDPTNLELWNFFISRVKDQLHMVLAFSPVGNKFRERAQKFPSVFSACSIDWFLAWPEEALVSVSHKFLSTFKMDCTKEIKGELERHIGKCHDLVTEVCEVYFQRMRRYVYVTPKSYLSFIELYKQVYRKKYDGIDVEESNIVSGLSKLKEASEGVEVLKIDLKKEDIMLKEAQEEVEKVLKELEVENRKAKIKSDEVAIVQKNCLEQKSLIEGEKEMADRDLAKAMPFLDRAIAAADSISPKDINELGGMRNAVDTTRLIMDAVQILFQRSLSSVKPRSLTILKTDIPFCCDSFDDHTKKTLTSKDFLKDITDFSNNQKDNITEETIELLEPYLLLATPDGREVFNGPVAKKSSVALGGLCDWAAAMSDYHKASKIVKPKLKLLEVKQGELEEAQSNLAAAESELAEVTALKERLKQRYDDAMGKKNLLEENAMKTRKKMDQANRLINSLADNKTRWIQNANEFKSLKQRLVGDCAKACAFVSYCGPFNADFRNRLLDEYFHNDIMTKGIPVSGNLQLTEFLVDQATIGEWNLEGLPSDELSVQNGIMVTRSSRYPLMIDPQGQAINWIKQREPILLEQNCIITLSHPNLKDALKFPLEMGYPMLIESIENEVDPMLDPILEKQIIKKGKNRLIKIAGQDLDFDEKFQLFMTSRLANPHFSPELAAKTTIIDFTVTQGGLE
jgi:dynein heavy chain